MPQRTTWLLSIPEHCLAHTCFSEQLLAENVFIFMANNNIYYRNNHSFANCGKRVKLCYHISHD